MDPSQLIDTAGQSGIPAPLWFVEFFKVLGFALHSVPMNLWYAGVLLAVVLHLKGSEQGKRFATRLMNQMPVIVALGVNLGVVPLLFTQLAYYKVFYPATILMAWFWLAIIVLLIPAYYGVYAYAGGLRSGGPGMTTWRRVAGWLSALMFIAIGFLFANGFSLMAHLDAWPKLWLDANRAGAPLGTALNVGDPSFWPRWLLMFGLALTTTAAWIRFDLAWFGRGESEQYQAWAARTAPKLYMLGMAWFAAAGSWYVFGTWPTAIRETMFSGPAAVLTIATAVSPGAVFLLLIATRRRPTGRAAATLIFLLQFGVLGVNAISRQVVQNVKLADYFDVLALPTSVELSPLVAFLVIFVAGLGVVAWMISKVVAAGEKPAV